MRYRHIDWQRFRLRLRNCDRACIRNLHRYRRAALANVIGKRRGHHIFPERIRRRGRWKNNGISRKRAPFQAQQIKRRARGNGHRNGGIERYCLQLGFNLRELLARDRRQYQNGNVGKGGCGLHQIDGWQPDCFLDQRGHLVRGSNAQRYIHLLREERLSEALSVDARHR